MPLTEEQQQTVYTTVASKVGLQANAGDRLDCFKLGIEVAVKVLGGMVSLDEPAPEQHEPAPANGKKKGAKSHAT
jgi:hypothetical protein